MTSPIGSSPSGPKHHAAIRTPCWSSSSTFICRVGRKLAAISAHHFEMSIFFMLCELDQG